MTTEAITSFDGPHRFLSNFIACPIALDGLTFRSVEHAYQAAKTLDPEQRQIIHSASHAADAKRFGRRVTMRPDWDAVKLDVMRDLLAQKFSSDNPGYVRLLLATGERELIEGNWWGDTFWGVCRGVGTNHLGRLLMERREFLVSNVTLES